MKTKDDIREAALTAIGDKRMAGVSVSMGVGKTMIGLSHMATHYTNIKKWLVVGPKTTIFASWKDDMQKFNLEFLSDHVTYTTYRSLLKQDFDYDCVYLDECHSLKANHNKWLLSYMRQGGRIVGLTGTYPVYKTSEKGKMCNFYCPKVYEYSPDEAIDDEILNNYQIIVHELTLSNRKNIARTGPNGDFFVSERSVYDYWTEQLAEVESVGSEELLRIKRMNAIQSFPSKESYAKVLFDAQSDKVLVFANTKKQAERICSDSVHSSNKKSIDNLIKFKNGKITKLSAVDQLSEGVNIPNLKTGIIMHAYANNRKTTQKIGRFLRLNPDELATIHILCYVDSVDKDWVTSALEKLDQSKIQWIKPKYHAGVHY